MRVLVLGPDRSIARTLGGALDGLEVHAAEVQQDGLRMLAEGEWSAILIDEDFSDAGLEILGRLDHREGQAPVVLLTSHPSMETTLAAIRRGAHDVVSKPVLGDEIREILSSVRRAGRVRPLPPAAPTGTLVGCSPEMLSVYKAVARASSSDATVLIAGESGTGKEMVARALHAQSGRARYPFLAINCAAIPENLLESELFGHEKGSFTGAIGRRIGRFERANRGTLFLDEVADMSLALQAKILRALQERELERVGGSESVPFDVRVVAATNQELSAAVVAGRFREDLYYRLAVVTLHLPPLRDRGADLDRLAEHFAAHYAALHGRRVRGISESTLDFLRGQSWPGNVRQLRNAMERAVVMCEGEVLLPEHLPTELLAPPDPSGPCGSTPEPLLTLAEMEERMIRRAIRETGGNFTRAAERLGIHRNTLRRKISDYGIAGA